jgi:serine/threonine protein kinase
MEVDHPMYKALTDMSQSQYLNLHNYIIYYKYKPKSEFISIDERYKEIALYLGETIDHLHSLGIVLRDLNTYNIMMDAVTDSAVPKVSSLKVAVIQGPEN